MQLPARIGKYELVEFLGGGMAHVYRATDTVLGRPVALKILTEQGNADPDARTRFLQEARMVGNIEHPNVISLYDFGEEQGRPFIVMEFLRGESLRSALNNNRAGDLVPKLRIAVQVARALAHVHEHNVIHRDIKPENVFLDPSGKAKLMDFGIAKQQGMSLTRAGFTLGTPYYMAPEQVMGQPVTHLVDVYAFGVLLFELLSGVKPVAGDTVERIFDHILHEPLDLAPLTALGVPQPVFDLIRRCTAKAPAERYQGFLPIVAELERILGLLGAPTGSSRPMQPGAAPRTEPLPPFLAWLPAPLKSHAGITAVTAAAVFLLSSLVYGAAQWLSR